jgi:hypothetical protein
MAVLMMHGQQISTQQAQGKATNLDEGRRAYDGVLETAAADLLLEL